MYRSASPYQQPPEAHREYHSRPYSPQPASGSASPGSVTYTTSMGAEGRPLYHPFKAVAASYQTSGGVVSGIQWVPGEATYILPAGAQPATMEFAASWSRGQLGREDERALNEWGRDDDKRRKKDTEKDARRLREDGMLQEAELRRARERDVQARERRKSFNAGAPAAPAAPGGYPSGGASGYPGTGYPPSPYSGYGDRPAASVTAPGYAASGGSDHSRWRNFSSGGKGYSDLDRQLGDLDLRDRDKEYERERKTSRPSKYSANEIGERSRAISGNLGSRPDAYGPPNPYGAAGGAYGGAGRPYSAAGHQPTASPNMRAASPNLRSVDAPYGAPGGYPPSNYSTSPPRGSADPPQRSITPFGGGNQPAVYPRGHVMEGQPIPRDRSRAPSPMPHGPPPLGPYSSSAIAFPQAGASPNMPSAVTFPGDQGLPQQLAAPEGFSRAVNGSHPFTPFDIIKVQDMEKFWSVTPRMPAVLMTHDVYEEDWGRLMQDVTLAWGGRLPVPEIAQGGPPPRRSALLADLVDLWNSSFFLIRGVELVLYKGRERRSGRYIGAVDKDLPYLSEPDDYPSSEDDEDVNDSNDSDLDYGQGRYNNVYGDPQRQMAEVFEAGRRRKEAKVAARLEARKRRHERNRKRREKFRAQKYSLYLTYIPTTVGGGTPHMGPSALGGYPAGPSGGGYGMGGRY